MKLYCIYDTLANTSTLLIEQPNDECAIRSLKPLLSEPNVDFSTYELHCLADYDKDFPKVEPENRIVGCLASYVEVNHE